MFGSGPGKKPGFKAAAAGKNSVKGYTTTSDNN
jgi:hypothetical protein